MAPALYCIFTRGRPGEIRAVGDHRRRLGVLPPVWALWEGLWLTALAMLALLAAAYAVEPRLAGSVWVALIALTLLEGAEIQRLELRLRGWREVAVCDAASEEGAEELYMTGRAVPSGRSAARRASPADTPMAGRTA